MYRYNCVVSVIVLLLSGYVVRAQTSIPISKGWSNNSINAVVFRQNSLVTQTDTQFIAFYTPEGKLALGKRHLKSKSFVISETQYKGNTKDAHNSISIMVDGEGFLHVSWDHHGHPLRYAKSVSPYSLTLGSKIEMTGINETNVTYPQFFKMPNGNLLFMFRDGRSGRGNLVVNSYDVITKTWTRLQNNLINGEGKRNAYWQACVDTHGVIHVSWVWRESPDVASNHDMCYARSKDGGVTWEDSKSKHYQLPITAATAEYACRIPQNSELINQTSMTTDAKGQPVIASYWREKDSEIPQYHVISLNDGQWETTNLNFRQTPFSLKGGGTKRIPISRPQIVVDKGKKSSSCYLIFRDEERGSKVSMAIGKTPKSNTWKIVDLTQESVGQWEPTFDTELWKDKGMLHLFVQKVEQADAEGNADLEPQMVQVLELKKLPKPCK